MQKHDHCELCGKLTDVADYGPNGEYICVSCGLDDGDRVLDLIIEKKGPQWVLGQIFDISDALIKNQTLRSLKRSIN